MHPRSLAERAERLFATGRTTRDIARELRVPERTVAYLLGSHLGDGHLTVGHRTACLWIYCADAWPQVLAEV